MVADLLTAFAVVALASAAIGAILTHCADVIHEQKDDE
jgi:hypothetical protein